MANQPHYEPRLDVPAFRKEAGEGWHKNGLVRDVLFARAFQDIIYTLIVEEYVEKGQRVPEGIHNEYQSQVAHVQKLKDQYGIGEPPQTSQ